ncbi:MAG: hypothetical protein LBR25_02735 [Erysipelotrichaceae bacterium]|jgi:hypothetical protein|nr:hypothetical protein [Erysipelotrichaceae bacterium]
MMNKTRSDLDFLYRYSARPYELLKKGNFSISSAGYLITKINEKLIVCCQDWENDRHYEVFAFLKEKNGNPDSDAAKIYDAIIKKGFSIIEEDQNV